jgi:hypothetical protein
MKANPDDPKFLEAVKKLNEGDTLQVDDGELVLEYKFTKPTHFPFHQRIFEPGVILHKIGSNVRIYIEAEKLGISVEKVNENEFEDKQIDSDGNVLPADRGIKADEVK